MHFPPKKTAITWHPRALITSVVRFGTVKALAQDRPGLPFIASEKQYFCQPQRSEKSCHIHITRFFLEEDDGSLEPYRPPGVPWRQDVPGTPLPRGPPHCNSVISQWVHTRDDSSEPGHAPGCVLWGLDVAGTPQRPPQSTFSALTSHRCDIV